MKNSLFLPSRFFFFCLTIFIYIVNANKHANRNSSKRINHPFSKRDHRLLQSSDSFSTAITKLTASDGGIENYFGDEKAVAISMNRIVVGAWGYNDFTGAAYLFMDPNNPESGRSYSQMAILTASDGCFGRSVDIDGDIVVVGAYVRYPSNRGAVSVFRILNESNNISQIAKLTAQNGATEDYFGVSVAIHGNFILVGSDNVGVGSAYLFVTGSSDSNTPEWTQIMQFQPDDLTEYNQFGYSVAMDDQISVIGAAQGVENNAAYVFEPVDDNNADSLSMWTQMAKLTGPEHSLFGYSVAVAGKTIVVGEPEASAVFVFTKVDDTTSSMSSSTWTQTIILLAADGADFDNFGSSVSISKDASTIVVGADYNNYNVTVTDSGAAYMFRNTNTATTGWTQVGKFVAADRGSNDHLGSSIAIENSIVVVGAAYDDTASGTSAGSVYILNTENSSSPTLVPTTETTTARTIQPVFPTLQPTLNSTTISTNPPTTIPPTTMAPTPNNDHDGNTNNPSTTPAASAPTTKAPFVSTPTPSNNNTTSTTKSDNNNIIITAITVVGAVVVILGLGIAFFNYRLKREDRQQQQQQQIMPPAIPPPSSGNDRMAAVTTFETPVMADVIFPNPTELTVDRTLPAEVLVDPPLTHAPRPGAVGTTDEIDAEKGLPHFKDQARTTGSPGPSNIPSSEPIFRNRQRNGNQEESPRTRQVQQRQQQLRDPPFQLSKIKYPESS